MKIFQKFWEILETADRLRGLKLLLITIIGAILEAAGVGLVLPFISIILSDNFTIPIFLTDKYPFLLDISYAQLLVGAISTFLVFYLFKSIFLLWLAASQAHYYYNLQESVSTRLFKSYLYKPYSFHLQHNSGKLLSNTITESMQFTVGFTAAALLTFNDVLIIIAILIVLFIAEPMGAILAFILFGTMSILLFIFSKKRSLIWGEARQDKERKRIQSAQQGFNGIKDIKLYRREEVFIDKYLKETHVSLDAGRKQTVLQNVPRIFLEFIAVFALCAIVLFLYTNNNQVEIISIVGLFAAAAFKLLPTISRLVQSSQAIIFNQPVVSFIYNELAKAEINTSSVHKKDELSNTNLNFDKNIKFSDLSFSYEGSEKSALNSINLNIESGKMIGFVGSSGAGKSTLIDCILCLIEPSSGTLSIDDKIITKDNFIDWQNKIGYVSQVIYLLDGTMKENIAFGIPEASIDEQKILEAVEKSQLKDFIESLPNGINTFVGERGVRLSGGQRQRIGIARALYNNPSVLVLDEATSSLDIETENQVMKAVESLHGDKTILIIAHRLTTVERCDYIYKLKDGAIIDEGKPDEVL